MKMTVQLVTPEQLAWPLTENDQHPRYWLQCGTYKRSFLVDPFPAYAAPVQQVTDLVSACEEKLPLNGVASATLYILNHEFLSRLNGLTVGDSLYSVVEPIKNYKGEVKEMPKLCITIVLSAKRIPLHPAMVSYLVTHEYGHAAFDLISRKMGYGEEPGLLEKEYMKIRGNPDYVSPEDYVGGNWHLSTGEIIANDFRTVVMGRDREFWPHTVPIADSDSPIAQWWKDAIGLIGRT